MNEIYVPGTEAVYTLSIYLTIRCNTYAKVCWQKKRVYFVSIWLHVQSIRKMWAESDTMGEKIESRLKENSCWKSHRERVKYEKMKIHLIFYFRSFNRFKMKLQLLVKNFKPDIKLSILIPYAVHSLQSRKQRCSVERKRTRERRKSRFPQEPFQLQLRPH